MRTELESRPWNHRVTCLVMLQSHLLTFDTSENNLREYER